MQLQETAREWSNLPYNFDNLGMGLMSLFVTATLNGYLGGAGSPTMVPTCCELPYSS